MNRSAHGRTALAAVSILLLTVAGAGSALAADPSGGSATGVLAYDATLAATFVLPAEAGGGPIDGAAVSVIAAQAGSIVVELNGTTGPDGIAAFEGLPREAAGGEPVLLTVTAGSFPEPPPGECQSEKGWTGTVDGVVAEVGGTVEIIAVATVADVCAGGAGGIPAGIISDAILTVTVLDDAGLPFPGVETTLIASLADGQGIAKDFGVTDAAGQATFSGLPRPDTDGPAIAWDVYVNHSVETTVDECIEVDEWFGSATMDAVSGASELTVPTTMQSSMGGCADPGLGSPVLRGTVVGPDGAPFTVTYATVIQDRPGGGSWYGGLVVQPDGAFETPIHAWGTGDAPSHIVISILGDTSRTVTDDLGCTTSYALYGEAQLSLAEADGAAIDPVAIIATERATMTDCAPGSEAGGSNPGPGVTLPPTDTVVSELKASRSGPGPMAVVVGLAFVAGAALVLGGRRPRRGPSQTG